MILEDPSADINGNLAIGAYSPQEKTDTAHLPYLSLIVCTPLIHQENGFPLDFFLCEGWSCCIWYASALDALLYAP